MTADDLTITHPQRSTKTNMKFLILVACTVAATAKPHVYLYDGAVEMPIDVNGRVNDDIPKITQIKTEHLAALRKAKAAKPGHEKSEAVDVSPFTADQLQGVLIFILADSVVATSSGHGSNKPEVPIGQYNQFVEVADEVAKMKAESDAKDTETSYSAASFPAVNSYQAQTAEQTQGFHDNKPSVTKPEYVNLATPIGEYVASSHHIHPEGFNSDALTVQDTQEYAVTKPVVTEYENTDFPASISEYDTSLSKPQNVNFQDTSDSSSSSEGSADGVLASVHEVQEYPVTKPIVAENEHKFPAPIGDDNTFLLHPAPQSGDSQATANTSSSSGESSDEATGFPESQEDPITKPVVTEHEGSDYQGTSDSSSSSEGSAEGGLASVHEAQEHPVSKPIVTENEDNLQPPIGEDDTFLHHPARQSGDFQAASDSSSSSEGSSDDEAVPEAQEHPITEPIVTENEHNFQPPIGKDDTFLLHPTHQGSDFQTTSDSSSSSGESSDEAAGFPEAQEDPITKPVVTEYERSDFQRTSDSSSSSGESSDVAPAFPRIQELPVNNVQAPIVSRSTHVSIAATQQDNVEDRQQTPAIAAIPDVAQQTLADSQEQESYHGEVIGTDEVSNSKIKYSNEKTDEASAATLVSSPSSSSFASTSVENTYAKVNQEADVFVPTASVGKSQEYDEHPTEIPLELKSESVNTSTTFSTVTHESNETFVEDETTVQPSD